MSREKFVEVYRAQNSVEAHLLKAALEAEGIDVRISGESLQTVIGAVPPGWQTAPQLLVPESSAEQARGILQRLERSKDS